MTYKQTALINAANLHNGGGVQVAVSFIYEIDKLKKYNFDVIVSNVVHIELVSLGVSVDSFNSYKIFDSRGILILLNFKFQKLLLNYDVVFTIFGPLYSWKKPNMNIVGFAQPWIIYPRNEIFYSYNYFNKLKVLVKYFLQWTFYRKSDKLLVELDHVKQRLNQLHDTSNIKILVANNCISSLYFNKNKWVNINFNKQKSDLTLGIVSRDYPHKNLKILPDVAEVLRQIYGINVRFLVTLTDDEWSMRDLRFYKYIDNVGSINIAQCPSFYKLLDGVIFPSLLECFSATPIESMIMKKPVFASDRLFIKQACDSFVNYFDPNNTESIARSIYKYFLKNELQRSNFVDNAYNHALKYNNPSARAVKYIKTIGSTS